MNQIETFFDTMAERWDAVCVHDSGKDPDDIGSYQPAAERRILDVGCGTGYWKVTCCRTNPAKS